MSNSSAIKKYYIGFAVLMAFAVVMLSYTIAQAAGAKTDRATSKSVQDIADKIDTYSADHGVPSNLGNVGIGSASSAIKYTKIDDSSYKICINYKEAAGGFDAGWTSLLGGFFSADFSSSNSQSSDQTYFDSSVIDSHKKGQNCQTIKPYTYNYDDYSNPDSPSNSSSDSSSPSSTNYTGPNGSTYSYDPCDDSSYTSYVIGKATVESISGTTEGTIVFNTDGQTIYDHFNNDTPAPVTSKQFRVDTAFCGADGKLTSSSAVKPGQQVSFYMFDISDTDVDRIQL